jgi:Zn-dependent peptidase ImmA (M78 family)
MHTLRDIYDDLEMREYKANRFAAELLLPTESLKREVQKKNKGQVSIVNWKHQSLLRFIARLHCEYKLPFKAIVKRLYEIEAIDEKKYQVLYSENTRQKDTLYQKIGLTIDNGVFTLLNNRTMKVSVDTRFLDVIITNFEKDIISEGELVKDLTLFDKKLEDFGLIEEVNESGWLEMQDLLKELEDES